MVTTRWHGKWGICSAALIQEIDCCFSNSVDAKVIVSLHVPREGHHPLINRTASEASPPPNQSGRIVHSSRSSFPVNPLLLNTSLLIETIALDLPDRLQSQQSMQTFGKVKAVPPPTWLNAL